MNAYLDRYCPSLRALAGFARTRKLAGSLKTRTDLEVWQNARIARWLKRDVSNVGYYRDRDIGCLEDLPVIDKLTLMSSFADFNQLRLDAPRAWRHLDGGSAPKGYHIGASTGTSGNRGLYIVSDAERYEWLGVMLGKLLPRYPWESARIAVILPTLSPLYHTANRAFRLHLNFFNLTNGLESVARAVEGYAPDTIIAPPHALRYLAECGVRLAPKRLYSAAEVLDPVDRAVIESRFERPLWEIYMATEGLLATPCAHGTLHLAEDVMHFELLPVEGGPYVTPVISDFIRRTQIMARYRLNDLLRIDPSPCRCGSPLRSIREIVGRMDDMFHLPRRDEGAGAPLVPVTPDVLRGAVLDTDRRIDDFRIVMLPPDHIRVSIPSVLSASVEGAVQKQIEALLTRLGARAKIEVRREALSLPAGKLRRVRCEGPAG